MKQLIAVYCIMGLLCGCASVPKADFNEDQAAKSFVAKPDKANIYLFRKSTFPLNAGIGLQVSLNGQIAGVTGDGTFFYWEVNPGNCVVSSQTAESTANLKINAEAGNNYFIQQKLHVGFRAARVSLEKVNEVEGRRETVKCSLVQNSF